MKFLETERLIFRELRASDWYVIFAYNLERVFWGAT
jgi:hypothetical protein